MHGERSGAPTGTDIALLRTAQEALANVGKHSDATTVQIELRQENGLMALAVTDDGQGFDPATVRGGYGLPGIGTRATSLGGTCAVRSAPGQGTTVRVKLPLAPAEQLARSLQPVLDPPPRPTTERAEPARYPFLHQLLRGSWTCAGGERRS
ncbi:sensor histidine kinase [Streptomyces sp. NPDC054813]